MNPPSSKTTINHYQHVSELSELYLIRNNKVNVTIYEREINDQLKAYTKQLIKVGFSPLNITLDLKKFDTLFDKHFETLIAKYALEHDLLKNDIKELITEFSKICKGSNLRIFFGLVDTDMCKRFHVDMYDLRMICTYEGQGTMWLKDDNINNIALNNHKSTEPIPLKENDIQQLNSSDVAIIKGALYPDSTVGGLVHKSPAIEALNEKRIVLRVDNNSLFDNIQ